jgi:hypothetical protein
MHSRKEALMSDFRNSDPLYRDPNDPTGNYGYEPAGGANASWGWLAGAVILLVVLGIAFGIGHEPSRVASNDVSPPTAMAPPASTTMKPLAPSAAPGLTPPPAQPPAAPNAPSGQ